MTVHRDSPPSMMIICLGANDILARPLQDNVRIIRQSLNHLHHAYPGVKIVWSDILNRQHYTGLSNQASGAHVKKCLNRVGRKHSEFYIEHHLISYRLPLFFDEVHLNSFGNNFFLCHLTRFLLYIELAC